MQNILKNSDFKISLLFALIGMIAGIFVGLHEIPILSEEIRQAVIAQYGSINALIIVAALQSLVYAFISSFAGLKLARKVNLKINPGFNKSALLLSIMIGLAAAFIIVGSDRFVFSGFLPGSITSDYSFSPIYLLTGILYGGIIEELLLRLFVMSLLVLIFWKLFARAKDKSEIPVWIYVTAIVLSSLLFAAGHLPNTAQTIGLSVPIIIRCFILNGIGGLGFGYLYWKKGLVYSMCAHASTHIFMQVIFMPLLFK